MSEKGKRTSDGMVRHIGRFYTRLKRSPERTIDPSAGVLQRIGQRLAQPKPLYGTHYYEWEFMAPTLYDEDRINLGGYEFCVYGQPVWRGDAPEPTREVWFGPLYRGSWGPLFERYWDFEKAQAMFDKAEKWVAEQKVKKIATSPESEGED